MDLANMIHNRLFVHGFLINSLPKAGTNLLKKVMGLYPGIRSSGIHVGWRPRREGHLLTRAVASLGILPVDKYIKQLTTETSDIRDVVPVGVVNPRYVPSSAIQGVLQRIGPGSFAQTHLTYSQELADLIRGDGIKMLLVLRDPRDVVVSQAYYVVRTPSYFLFEHYRVLSESERITASIVGVKGLPGGEAASIQERLSRILPWKNEAFAYTTYFEKLVGPQGGSSRKEQLRELGMVPPAVI